MIPSFTFGSKDGARRHITTGYTDSQLVRAGNCVLLNLFGYNSGAVQFLHLIDTNLIADANAPTIEVLASEAGDHVTPALSVDLTPGDVLGAVRLTGITGVTIAYARALTITDLGLYLNLADAAADTNRIDLTVDEEAGVLSFLPTHFMAIGAADNFSMIIPVTGLNFSRGLVVAVSTTGPYYTAGAKEVAFSGTLLA